METSIRSETARLQHLQVNCYYLVVYMCKSCVRSFALHGLINCLKNVSVLHEICFTFSFLVDTGFLHIVYFVLLSTGVSAGSLGADFPDVWSDAAAAATGK